jgi:hypothetical protein
VHLLQTPNDEISQIDQQIYANNFPAKFHTSPQSHMEEPKTCHPSNIIKKQILFTPSSTNFNFAMNAVDYQEQSSSVDEDQEGMQLIKLTDSMCRVYASGLSMIT